MQNIIVSLYLTSFDNDVVVTSNAFPETQIDIFQKEEVCNFVLQFEDRIISWIWSFSRVYFLFN